MFYNEIMKNRLNLILNIKVKTLNFILSKISTSYGTIVSY